MALEFRQVEIQKHIRRRRSSAGKRCSRELRESGRYARPGGGGSQEIRQGGRLLDFAASRRSARALRMGESAARQRRRKRDDGENGRGGNSSGAGRFLRQSAFAGIGHRPVAAAQRLGRQTSRRTGYAQDGYGIREQAGVSAAAETRCGVHVRFAVRKRCDRRGEGNRTARRRTGVAYR